jgi:hypothetical protein
MLAIFSVVIFLGSLIVIPWIIGRMPEDYFLEKKRHVAKLRQYHPLVYFLIRLLKNLAALVLIIAGFIMLFTPGQGLLTMLVGLGLSDFPGKYTLERKIVRNKKIFKALNWVRKRAGAVPLLYPEIDP